MSPISQWHNMTAAPVAHRSTPFQVRGQIRIRARCASVNEAAAWLGRPAGSRWPEDYAEAAALDGIASVALCRGGGARDWIRGPGVMAGGGR